MTKLKFKGKSNILKKTSSGINPTDFSLAVKEAAQCPDDPCGDGGSSVGYKKYVALLSQTGQDDPVATVLENTLGGVPVWTRYSMGQYLCTLPDAFPKLKTFCSVTRGYDWGNLGNIYFGHAVGDDFLYMYFLDYSGSSNDIMNGPSGNDLYVEIRVYP